MPRSNSAVFLAGGCLLAALGLLPTALSAQHIRTGFDTESLSRGGNSSSGPIELPFLTNIRGSTDDQLSWGDPNLIFVCTDGFVSLGLLSNTCPSTLSWAGQLPPTLITGALTALAPLYRDLSLSFNELQGGSIGWGLGAVQGRSAWGATWFDVSTNSSNDAAFRNSFQLVLIERSDRALGDFDVEFNYGFLGQGYNSPTDVFAGAYDIGGFLDPNGVPYDEYRYEVAPAPFSRITMCWVGGSVNNSVCAPGGGDPNDPIPVPEPASWTLVAAGLGAMRLVRRRGRTA